MHILLQVHRNIVYKKVIVNNRRCKKALLFKSLKDVGLTNSKLKIISCLTAIQNPFTLSSILNYSVYFLWGGR